MKLVPAIDLIGGRCVRLAQGDFERATSYSLNPAEGLALFAQAGAEEAHLVDLDGARAGEPRQHELFKALAAGSALRLQVAGGFRSARHVEVVLAAGVDRVVIGSLALADPSAFAAMLREFGPERIVLAIDIRLVGGKPMVASDGWQTQSARTLDDLLSDFPDLTHLLVTDIDRDGMLNGPNVELMRSVAANYPFIELQASGGVSKLDDLAALRETGASRAIVGKAIWEERFSIREGVICARG